MTTAQPPEESLAPLLRELIGEVREIKELLSLFTNDGMPILSSLPSSELIASACMAAGLIARESQTIKRTDLNGKLQAAQVVALELVRMHDSYITNTQRQRLEELRSAP